MLLQKCERLFSKKENCPRESEGDTQGKLQGNTIWPNIRDTFFSFLIYPTRKQADEQCLFESFVNKTWIIIMQNIILAGIPAMRARVEEGRTEEKGETNDL